MIGTERMFRNSMFKLINGLKCFVIDTYVDNGHVDSNIMFRNKNTIASMTYRTTKNRFRLTSSNIDYISSSNDLSDTNEIKLTLYIELQRIV